MSAVLFDRAPLERYPTLAAWHAEAPRLVAELLENWELTAGTAFTGGAVGAVLAVTTIEGDDAVLKAGFPHHEAVGEALGLEAWAPQLAPGILRQDAQRWALLLERVRPGTPLSRAALSADEAIAASGDLLRALHSNPAPAEVPRIRDVVGVWLGTARQTLGRVRVDPAEIDAVRRGLSDATALLDSDSGGALLHGDANPGNILLAAGGRWVAIDPKPMTGDAEFDLGPLASQLDDPWDHSDPVAVLEPRMRELVDRVGGDWYRAVRWAAARAALETTWAWADGAPAAAAAALQRLRTWQELSEP